MLGVNSNTLSKYRRGNHPTRKAQLLHIEDILAIHKALIVLLSAQAGSVLHWIKGRNEAFMGEVTDGIDAVRRFAGGKAVSGRSIAGLRVDFYPLQSALVSRDAPRNGAV